MLIKNKIIKILLSALLILNVPLALASTVVIGNSAIKIDQLTKNQITNIYLGKSVKLSSDEKLKPFDQASSSAIYADFYKTIVGRSVSAINNYWTALIFSGEGNQPTVVNGDAAVIDKVANTPNAIAYVDSASLNGVGNQVKVLYGDGSALTASASTNGNDTNSNNFSNVKSDSYYHSMYSQNASPVKKTFYHSDELAAPTDTQSANQDFAKLVSAMSAQNAALDTNTNIATRGNVWNEIQSQLQLGSETNYPEVKQQLLWYASHPKILNSLISSATPYIYYVNQQIQKRRMPAIFTLLPMVESGYDPYAYSRTGASGLWQMMPGTAAGYGLNIDWWYDGRRDLITSTNAALNYLQGVYHDLGNWYLAAASYNAGEGAVQNAMRYNRNMHRDTTFWSLPLPQETRSYVPKLIALAMIIKNPSSYGVQLPQVPNHDFFTAFKMGSQMDVGEISQLSGVSVPVIQRLNPGIRRWSTAPDGQYTLLIPVSNAESFKNNLAQAAGKTHFSWQYHEVHQNETLQAIAKNYHTSLTLLAQVNQLGDNPLQTGEGLLVPIRLNKKLSNPMGEGNIQLAQNDQPKSPEYGNFSQLPMSADVTPGDILSGNLVLPSQQAAASQTQNIPTMTPSVAEQAALSVTVQDPSHMINKADSLKQLIAKIYGKD